MTADGITELSGQECVPTISPKEIRGGGKPMFQRTVNVCYGMAAYGPVHHLTIQTLLNMHTDFLRNSPHGWSLSFVSDSFICGARKAMVEQAMQMGATYILFLDADMVFPFTLPRRLVFLAEHYNLPIVSGYYSMRNPPYLPLTYMCDKDGPRADDGGYNFKARVPITEKGLLQCDACGFGCCLINLEVFAKIKQPWFALSDERISEDIYFFRKAFEQGIHPVVDVEMQCGHIGPPRVVVPEGVEGLPILNQKAYIVGNDHVRKEFKLCETDGTDISEPTKEESNVSK